MDLPDYDAIENFVCADFSAIHKYIWSSNNYILNGFKPSGLGTSQLSVAIAGSVCLLGENQGVMYIGAPSLSDISTTNLTPASTNFVEIYIDEDSGGSSSRAFWDKTANAGQGAEFSQIVDTFLFIKANLAINASGFTGDPDKIAICEVDVGAGGEINEIRDARNMFFRLGKFTDLSYDFPWSSRVEPNNTDFNGADKDITSLKDWFDAVMSSLKEIKGSTYWYEVPGTSMIGTFRNLGLSVLSGASNTASFKWTGSELLITDDALAPSDTDTIAYLRFFDALSDLELTRQDSTNGISLADGDVLWVEIPSPLANVSYDGVGSTLLNYRVTSRGSMPTDDHIYWLAFREGSRIYLRGLGELEPGEERQINDETPEALAKFLGFNPETATSVPYTFTPNSLIFGNLFDNTSTLVEAISTNAANINGLGAALQENAYAEIMDVVIGVPVNSNEIQGPVPTNTIITIPEDSRNAGVQKEYLVGEGLLKVWLNGQLLNYDRDFEEVGTPGTLNSSIKILLDLVVGDALTFRVDSLGGFNVGAGGGGDVTNASNIGTGTGDIYKQKVTGVLELRRIKAGAGISVVTSGDDIIISLSGGTPEPYFVNYITGQTSTLVGVGADYNLGTDKLAVYRNGVRMLNSSSLGNAIDRFQEATNNSILLEDDAISSEVFTFVNQADDPSYVNLISGLSTTTITVPNYNMGTNELKVWRNGVLMNAMGMGAAIDQYTETSNTIISLAATASPSDVFIVQRGPAPSWREDITSQTGATITLSSSYTVGSKDLLVFRNGVLMLNSTTLALPLDRYQETSSVTIELEVAAVATDVFSFIRK